MSEPANTLFHRLNRLRQQQAAPRLTTPSGRYSRAAVVERAQEIYHAGRSTWGQAMAQAHREAAAELGR